MLISEVQIPSQVIDQITMESKQSPKKEIIGLLFGTAENMDGLNNSAIDGMAVSMNQGKLTPSPQSNIILIFKAIFIRTGKRREVHLIDSDYERILPLVREMQSEGLNWIGWYHSHPFSHGDHLHYSMTDLQYHAHQQRLSPIWVGIVVNHHQITDPTTLKGCRCFTLQNPVNLQNIQANRICILPFSLQNSDR